MGSLFLIGIGALIAFCYLALARRLCLRAAATGEYYSSGVSHHRRGPLGHSGRRRNWLARCQLYKSSLEREAVEFAQLTFHRVFINRDPHFLEDHSTEGQKHSRPQEFINLIDDQLGETKSVGPFSGEFWFKFNDRSLHVVAIVRTRALFENDGAWINIQISGTHDHWEIEHLRWEY